MSGKAIPSSYTIDGLLGLNRQDEHKHTTKQQLVIDQATHRSGHSTDKRQQGTVLWVQLMHPKHWVTNKLGSKQGVQHIQFTWQNCILTAGGILPQWTKAECINILPLYLYSFNFKSVCGITDTREHQASFCPQISSAEKRNMLLPPSFHYGVED